MNRVRIVAVLGSPVGCGLDGLGRLRWNGSSAPRGCSSPSRLACPCARGGPAGTHESHQQRASLLGVQTQNSEDTGSAAFYLPKQVRGQTVLPTQGGEMRLSVSVLARR